MYSILFGIILMPSLWAQTHPFWNDIQHFKEEDSLRPPAPGPILFVGSSSFTLWKDVGDYFPGRYILNRAFGGSTIADLIYYEKDILKPYKPVQIVMYCGENDFASSDTVTVDMVYDRFQKFYKIIRGYYPGVSFVYVSMKPSPSRKRLSGKYEIANSRIKDYLGKQKNCVFVDVYHPMLNADGSMKNEIYREDQLHMNEKGYAIWKKLLEPRLLENGKTLK